MPRFSKPLYLDDFLTDMEWGTDDPEYVEFATKLFRAAFGDFARGRFLLNDCSGFDGRWPENRGLTWGMDYTKEYPFWNDEFPLTIILRPSDIIEMARLELEYVDDEDLGTSNPEEALLTVRQFRYAFQQWDSALRTRLVRERETSAEDWFDGGPGPAAWKKQGAPPLSRIEGDALPLTSPCEGARL